MEWKDLPSYAKLSADYNERLQTFEEQLDKLTMYHLLMVAAFFHGIYVLLKGRKYIEEAPENHFKTMRFILSGSKRKWEKIPTIIKESVTSGIDEDEEREEKGRTWAKNHIFSVIDEITFKYGEDKPEKLRKGEKEAMALMDYIAKLFIGEAIQP